MRTDANDRPVLTIGHSPDPDDAFMWWPLGDASQGRPPVIDTGGFLFTPVAEDIESLNRRAAERGDLDFTAISIRNYPSVRDRYILTACGASMGDGYGPKVVARRGESDGVAWLTRDDVRIAIPGVRTSAWLALRLCAGTSLRHVETPFERIIDEVASGQIEAGLVIHEGQLTYEDSGLELVVDLGAWWKGETGLPLPLGGNAARRDLDERLGDGAGRRLEAVLRASIEHAMAQRAEGVELAMAHARGISRERADRFISMYVNDLTIDAGERGAGAIRAFLGRGAAAGLCEDPGGVELLG
ncbi:MAG: ABC transporter substrate-binding protein, partial [Phycisphaeraceae bacterium]